MKPSTTIVKDGDKTFLARKVRNGERYGREFCLIHTESDPLIEFYDYDYDFEVLDGVKLGQFISRYYQRSMRERGFGSGLDLMGHEPKWKVSAEAMREVYIFVGSDFDERTEAFGSNFDERTEA